MSVYVFLGPTLPVDEARRILDARYLPPVAMGDVYAAAEAGPDAIAIVDGFFEQTPAVWHKEILYALSKGIRVFGSSSMGALRAAELHAFGMEGIGRVFQGFRDGEWEDDDEVAVVHGPAEAGFRVLSDAMVNIRLGLKRAEAAGLVAAQTSRGLERLAKDLFYPTRSWSAVLDAGRAAGLPASELDRLAAFVRREKPDQKREDAVALLEHIARERTAGLRSHEPAFELEPTVFWTRLTTVAQRVAGDTTPTPLGASAERVRRHVRAIERHGKDRFCGALLLHLVTAEARRLGLAIPSLAVALERFRRARGLTSAASLQEWMARHHVSRQRCAEIAEVEMLRDALLEHHADAVDSWVPAELQRRGEWGDLVERVERKWKCLEARGIQNPTVADTGVPVDEVLRWHQSRGEAIHTDLDAHARERGFDGARPFVTEVLAEYIAQHPDLAGTAENA